MLSPTGNTFAASVEQMRRRVDSVPAYRPGRPGANGWGKLSSNESAFGPAPAVLAAITAAATEVGRYPNEAETRAAVAAEVGVDASSVLLTNGSDELCYLLAVLALSGGRACVVGDPCYLIDANASAIAGAEVRRIPLRDGVHDLGAMAKGAADAAVVWLPNPHNPTGRAVAPAGIADFLDSVPEHCLVVLDEAYRGYAPDAFVPEVTVLLAGHPNLIVQRTFSKDHGLAGLRVGYAIAHPSLVSVLGSARPPFSVNTLALAAVRAALTAPAWRSMVAERVLAGRQRLETELEALGVEYFPSQANFVAARVPYERLEAPAAQAGLALRPGENFGMPGWTRLTIGWEPEQAALIEVLRAALRLHPAAAPRRQP